MLILEPRPLPSGSFSFPRGIDRTPNWPGFFPLKAVVSKSRMGGDVMLTSLPFLMNRYGIIVIATAAKPRRLDAHGMVNSLYTTVNRMLVSNTSTANGLRGNILLGANSGKAAPSIDRHILVAAIADAA